MEGISELFASPFPNELPPNDLAPAPLYRRNRLGADGVAILETYWLRNSNNPLELPPLSDRKELTRAIKDLPGCAFWNAARTADWFKRRMKKLQSGSAYPSLPSQEVYPSKDAKNHLAVLLKSQPNPSPDVIRTWATLLARDGGPAAVQFWTGYITQAVHDSEVSSQSPDCPSANLPTPAGTVTPEPRALVPQSLQQASSSNDPLLPKIKRDPADSPTVASLTIRTQPTGLPPPLSTPKIESPVSPFLRARQTKPRPTSLRAIIEDVVQTTQDPIESSGPLPNDADEFLAMFAPYEVKLTKLLHMLDSHQ